jgi:hypothetical protein
MKFPVRILTLILVTVAISSVGVHAFESGMWPGEGRPVFVAKSELTLYEKPLRSSRIVRGSKISKGRKLDFAQTVYRTTKSGWFKVLATSSASVRSYGAVDVLSAEDYYNKGVEKAISFKAGDLIEFLQYRAEGECIARVGGEVMAFSPDANISVVAEPQTEWWIEIVNKQKNPIGWVLIDKKTVASLDREF